MNIGAAALLSKNKNKSNSNPSWLVHGQSRGSSGFSYDFRDSDEFKNALEQLRNANSPYISELENLQGLYGNYGTSFGERLGLFFGSDLSSQYTDLQNAAFANINAILQKENARVYNLPSNQSSLERAAGLNTDLAGVSGIGQVTDADNPVEQPSLSSMSQERSAQEMSVPQTVVNVLSSVAGSVFQFANSMNVLKSASADIASREIGAYGSAQDFVISQIANAMSVEDFTNPLMVSGEIIKAAKKIDLAPYSRSTRKFIRQFLSSLDESKLGPQSEIYGKLASLVESKRNSAKTIGMPDFDEDFGKMLDIMQRSTSKYVYEMFENDRKLKEYATTIQQYEAQVSENTAEARERSIKANAEVVEGQAFISSETRVSEAAYRNAVNEYRKIMADLQKGARAAMHAAFEGIDNSDLPAWAKAAAKYSLYTGETALQGFLSTFTSGSGYGVASKLLSGKGASSSTDVPRPIISFDSYDTFDPLSTF